MLFLAGTGRSLGTPIHQQSGFTQGMGFPPPPREEAGKQARRHFIISAQSAGSFYEHSCVHTSLAC